MLAGQNYKGVLVAGIEYKVLETGFDYYRVSAGGKPVYVPKWVTERCPEQEARKYEREEND